MPFYEYKCLECPEITEVLRSIKSRDDVMKCSRCGARTKRIMSKFNTVTTKKSKEPKVSKETPEIDNLDRKPHGTGISMGGGSVTMKDCSFENLETGISITKAAKLSMSNPKFKNVAKPIQVSDG